MTGGAKVTAMPAMLLTLFLVGLDSPIKKDEVVVFLPTVAHRDEQGTTWVLPIHGWIYEPERDSFLRRQALDALRRSLGLSERDAASAVFIDRASRFLVDNERGKEITIRLGARTFTMPPSEPSGHFRGTVRLSAAEANRLAQNGWLTFTAVTPAGDDRAFRGRVQLVEPEGLTVVSDIDDTIKISEVRNPPALLANTFLREFAAAPGMAEFYRGLAGRGPVFHYVSSSPWQLYEPLDEFRRKHDFPAGSFHMRLFRLKITGILVLFASPEEFKPTTIGELLKTFPKRRFLLIGDSGEKDPEIYGALARKHPQQIVGIYIRDVTGEGVDAPRYQQAFADVPRERWQIFRQPKEITVDLPHP
jgi:hypothetical protein